MQLWHGQMWAEGKMDKCDTTAAAKCKQNKKKKTCSSVSKFWAKFLANSELNYIQQDIHHDNGLRGQLLKKIKTKHTHKHTHT